jgi:DNA polymerase-1
VRLATFATPEEVVVFDLFRVPPEVLRPLFGEAGPVLVGHNLKFDLAFLLALGLWEGTGKRLWDTGLTHQVLTASSRMPALKDLVPGLDKTLQASDWGGELTEAQVQYAALDAWATLSLYRGQREEARRLGVSRVVALENRALPAVAWMEAVGVPFDPALWEKAAKEADKEADKEAERKKESLLESLPKRVEWDSPAQVLAYLKAEGLPVEDTREETLAAYRDHPIVAALLAYREASKRVSTYGQDWVRKWVKGGRLYPSWKQIGAETGRMACSSPNLQQVPRDPALRRAFRPGPGRVLIKADYSQIELRLAAAIAKDRRMLEAFTKGEDLHRLTASLVLGKPPEAVSKEDRQLAKALNFGLIYGLGAEGLRKHARAGYGLELTPEEAQRFRAAFFRAYPGLRAWHSRIPKGAVEVRTLLGRRRVTERYTEKLNTPVQGSGADGLKAALVLLWEERAKVPARTFPVLAVHDEVVVEAPEEAALGARAWLEEAMRRGMGAVLKEVPVEVEAGVYLDWGITPWGE